MAKTGVAFLFHKALYKGEGVDIVPDIDSSDITSPGDIAKSRVGFLLFLVFFSLL